MRIPVIRKKGLLLRQRQHTPLAKVTVEKEESNSKESNTDDIDVWTASRPTKPNTTTAATTLKLTSKTTSTRPGTREPTQDPVQDKTSNKSWHKKTNTVLTQEEDLTEKKPPDDTIENEEATKNKAEWKDCLSDKPVDGSPTNNGGAVVTTEEVIDEPNDDKEANENDAEWKDVTSREPDHDPPTADGDAATTIGELDKPSDESPTITDNSESKEPGPHN
jgi:hypothetical protein